MTILGRVTSYYRGNGLRSTLARCLEAVRRLTNGGGMALYSCPLPIERITPTAGISIQRVGVSTLLQADGERVFGGKDCATSRAQCAARFGAGSELWLARIDGHLAGSGWTIQGRTIEPHFFPIQSDEVHFFDFFVVPEFRGRGVNVALMAEALSRLSDEHIRLAHLECATWNAAQLRSLNRSLFRRYAVASKIKLCGRPVVIWHRNRSSSKEADFAAPAAPHR